ncbi:condensation domain-containing protein [Alkalinema sp. FACHB-956]|uniref:non-ribosomal peptide synthetase n=1 Tax=Alkalinema sp. FACHB-956 TaxID=2692768 RepID=UPI001688A7D3|nr:condensation domain-containing protein [Alkalinema sp. FACHB-956]MBD2329071.1 AMP-binding protein [Alkalinema sp. FACHB-956]
MGLATLDQLLSELRQREVQLWLEGDRLRYRAAKDVLSADLLAAMKARKAELIEFLQQAIASANAHLPTIATLDRSQPLPLSFAQQRFWMLQQFEPQSSSNNMPVVVRFTGHLNVAVLEQSLQEVVNRHEVLRATFPAVKGQPTLVIHPEVQIKLPIVDLQHLPKEQRTAEAHRLATHEAHYPIDLNNGPMLRLLLLRLSTDEHLLLWNLHCLVCDGASSDVFYQDLTTIYGALIAGQPSPLAPLPIQYADFAHWQRNWLQGEVLDRQLSYWKQQLSGSLPIANLPYNQLRPPIIRTYKGDRSARMLPKELNDQLTALSQRLGGTLFMVLLAAFELLLYRYAQQEEMLISFASGGRSQVETERLLGFFSNTLILRAQCGGNPTFRELFDRVRQATLKAYAHQDVPFEKIIEELKPEGQNLLSLFQVKFALNPPWSNGRGMASVQLPDLTITSLFGYIYHGQTKYDLILVMREQDEGLGAVFDYNAELFDAATIAQMLGHFQTLLEQIVANPDRLISELPLLTPEEQAQRLALVTQACDLNSAALAPSKQPALLHRQIELQAERYPQAIAIVEDAKAISLTYSQLNQQANQRARHLQEIGVQAGDRVAVACPRSIDLMVTSLAVLKLGAAFLWLHPNQPLTNPSQPLTDIQSTDIQWLLTQSADTLTDSIPVPTLTLDSLQVDLASYASSNLDLDFAADSLACIVDICQGIALSHEGLLTLLLAPMAESTESAIVLSLSPLDSGLVWHELWGSLVQGQTIVLPQNLTLKTDPAQVAQWINQAGVSDLWMTTPCFHQWMTQWSSLPPSTTALRSLRRLWVVGDFLTPSQVQQCLQILPHGQIRRCDAPNTQWPIVDWSLVTLTQAGSILSQESGTSVRDQMVLDSHHQPLPAGAIGRLYLELPGVVPVGDRGSEDVISHGFQPKAPARLYRTTSLARYGVDGSLERLGHYDRQVKIRDFVVQLHLIEHLLHQHPAIAEVCVVAQLDGQGQQHLVTYFVPHLDQAVTGSDLVAFLKEQLPSYGIPSVFVTLPKLPLTDRGNYDFAQLPIVEDVQLRQESQIALISSRDDLELQLTQLWEEVLGIRPIGIRDNFFDLGGHSLLAVQLFGKIETVFGTALPLATLLQAPTIEQQAELIRTYGITPPQEWLVPLQQGTSDNPPLFCIYGILLYHDLAKAIGADQTVYGLYLQEEVDLLRQEGLEVADQLGTVQQVAERYLQKVRTIQPTGPYLLAGESFGGIVAYEMAQLLQAQGETVALLAMFDTLAPDCSLKLSRSQRATQHLAKLVQEGPTYLLEKVGAKLKSKVGYAGLTLDRSTNSTAASVDDLRQQFRQQIGKNYQPSAYAGKVTLFRALDRGEFESIEVDPLFGWDRFAELGVDAFDIPGDHIGILKDPNVQPLAHHLRHCIRQGLLG